MCDFPNPNADILGLMRARVRVKCPKSNPYTGAGIKRTSFAARPNGLPHPPKSSWDDWPSGIGEIKDSYCGGGKI